jgi:DUF1009 family protein
MCKMAKEKVEFRKDLPTVGRVQINSVISRKAERIHNMITLHSAEFDVD